MTGVDVVKELYSIHIFEQQARSVTLNVWRLPNHVYSLFTTIRR